MLISHQSGTLKQATCSLATLTAGRRACSTSGDVWQPHLSLLLTWASLKLFSWHGDLREGWQQEHGLRHTCFKLNFHKMFFPHICEGPQGTLSYCRPCSFHQEEASVRFPSPCAGHESSHKIQRGEAAQSSCWCPSWTESTEEGGKFLNSLIVPTF